VSDATGSLALWIAVLSTAAVTLTIFALAWIWDAGRRERLRRSMLERVGPVSEPVETPTAVDLFRESPGLMPGRLAGLIALLPRSGDLCRLIEQSALGWSPGRFALLTMASALALGAVTYLITGFALMALPAAMLGGTFPWLFVRHRKSQRVSAFEESFPEAIDLLCRAIRAGHGIQTALKMVGDELGDPLGMEFRRVFEEQKFGLPLEESLAGLAERIDLADVRIFNTGVLIPRRVGGNLAEILDTLARTIRERFMIHRQVRVYTAQGRFTGYLLAVLPIVIGFMIYLLNRDYLSILWTEDFGRGLIVTALLLQVVGFFVIRRIVDIEV
jgi:tight adherence protein B